jgi:hypothetical protein
LKKKNTTLIFHKEKRLLLRIERSHWSFFLRKARPNAEQGEIEGRMSGVADTKLSSINAQMNFGGHDSTKSDTLHII